MIVKIFKKNRRSTLDVAPDEIFLDSKNLPNFNLQQFEGRIEKTISKNTILTVCFLFFFCLGIFGVRLWYLQIHKGEEHLQRSENNTLEKAILFADRGIIYDRNKNELAWNKKMELSISELSEIANEEEGVEKKFEISFPTRHYLSPGFSHVLGYVNYPAKDKQGNYWRKELTGKDGLEKQYNTELQGENGSKTVETDARGNIHSENVVDAPKQGAGLVTTIDSRIQKELFDLIKNLSESRSFDGGAGIIMDLTNGEILTSTSFPEYDSFTLSLGKDRNLINSYINDRRKVFLDRTMSGLYTPGSIVKPFFALAALHEGLIDPNKEILSTGSISIQNPYFKDQKTIFKDWKAHGWTNMTEAIAVSSDVYFYSIGGGFEDQKGLGIANIEKYSRVFSIGEKTGVDLPDEKGGVIPNPEWKLKNFNGEPWRIGNTYHTSIGQYGFQVTPMEMVRAVAALANHGTLVTPHFLLNDDTFKQKNRKIEPIFSKEHYDIVNQGMRETVTYGTAVSLNVPYVQVAAKTGTAQLGISKSKVNSWVIGFFPYENPKYAFTLMMEAGPSQNSVGASSVMRQLLDWMSINTPEYFKVV